MWDWSFKAQKEHVVISKSYEEVNDHVDPTTRIRLSKKTRPYSNLGFEV